MTKYLPVVFLISVFCLFGIAWIVWDVDPDVAPFQLFALLVTLIFIVIFGFLGLGIYFVRAKLNKRLPAASYIFSGFKVSFFAASLVSLLATLSLLKLITPFNLFLLVSAVSLLALYVYLGKRK